MTVTSYTKTAEQQKKTVLQKGYPLIIDSSGLRSEKYLFSLGRKKLPTLIPIFGVVKFRTSSMAIFMDLYLEWFYEIVS